MQGPRSAHHRPRAPTVAGSGCRGRSDPTTRRRAQTGGKKTPEVIEAIEILLEHDTAGDPITGIRWTHKTPAGIAELLRQLDIEISANTVARLLRNMDFSLRVNRKAIATDSSPNRDQQFRYISSLRTRFERQGLPMISVDTKKRELVGNFKNNGVKWDRTPVSVNDHDFRSDAIGVAIPYGIYDLLANRSSVFVSVSYDGSLCRPLHRRLVEEGRRWALPPRSELLILADTGGSNSYRTSAWKPNFKGNSA